MSNRLTPYTSTASTAVAGTTPVSLSLSSREPSVAGKLLRLAITMTSGSTTTATTIEVLDAVSGTVFRSWSSVPLAVSTPVDEADNVATVWDVAAPADLQVRIITDDATNSTALDVVLTGEAA